MMDHIMKKKKFDYKQQTLDISELVKQRPVLTEEEMRNFYSYEEAVQECMRLLDEGINKIQEGV